MKSIGSLNQELDRSVIWEIFVVCIVFSHILHLLWFPQVPVYVPQLFYFFTSNPQHLFILNICLYLRSQPLCDLYQFT